MITEKDLAAAFRAGWDERGRCVSIRQPTTARDEFYGVKRLTKAEAKPVKYHHSRFMRWNKARPQ